MAQIDFRYCRTQSTVPSRLVHDSHICVVHSLGVSSRFALRCPLAIDMPSSNVVSLLRLVAKLRSCSPLEWPLSLPLKSSLAPRSPRNDTRMRPKETEQFVGF